MIGGVFVVSLSYDDLRRYSGYLPVRWVHEDVIRFLDSLIVGWSDGLFLAYWTGRYIVKVYYGERMEVCLLEKEPKGSHRHVSLSVWLDLSSLDAGGLSAETLAWLGKERLKYVRCGGRFSAGGGGSVLDI